MDLRPGGGGSLGAAAGLSPDYTLEDGDSAARETLILALRLTEGVELTAFEKRWAPDVRRLYDTDLSDPQAAGLVEIASGRLRLTRKGVPLANEVFSRLAR